MKKTEAKILVVDDDTAHVTTLKVLLESWGYSVDIALDGDEAVGKVKNSSFDLILMDIKMVKMSGIEALKKIKEYNPAIPIIMMTAYSSVESAVEAMKSGAYDYLMKPLDFDALKITINRAMEHINLKMENERLKKVLGENFNFNNIIGQSEPIKNLLEKLAMVAPSDANVLITGESGTGKELIARAIHLNSNRNQGPFVAVNCAALTETLLESELFGHEKGAFTGADKKREGRFVSANKGTLFLDEIGEMPITMQPKLLRAIQEGEIQPIGSDKIVKVDVRIIAATNRNLEEEIEKGNFREDLYYRLNVVNLHIPPLRERVEDIPILAKHFLNIYGPKNKKEIKGISPQAMDLLLKYNWPGNVRELENAIEHAVVLCTGDYITEKELPLRIRKQSEQIKEKKDIEKPSLDASLEELEKKAIIAALKKANGNKSEAARLLKITRRTLYLKMQKYGIQ